MQDLSDILHKFEELEARLATPEVINDTATYRELLKEHHRLTPIVTAYRDYLAATAEHRDLVAMSLDSDTDDDLREIATEEAATLRERIDALEESIQILLLPRDENDERNVIVEIRAGAGGEEAALFAADLYRMYRMYTDSIGLSLEPIGYNETELGGFREISFLIEGEGAYSRFKFESGVHRVQRVPVTESQGRIQTSTVTVAVLPEAEEVDVEINPADVVMEACKSSGAGGQHINKTESAVRLTHKPTGIVVECQEERSQFKNRDKAMKMLRAKLLDIKTREQESAIAAERRGQVGTGDRSEKIRTYNYRDNRLTDHRIGLSLYSLDRILNGILGEVVDALIAADTARKMQEEQS